MQLHNNVPLWYCRCLFSFNPKDLACTDVPKTISKIGSSRKSVDVGDSAAGVAVVVSAAGVAIGVFAAAVAVGVSAAPTLAWRTGGLVT